MAEITLSEYTGYIYLEMIKAREMADMYSKSVAVRYEQDPILKNFPTPRFRIPKLNLTIPMLVSGARFSQVVRFNMSLPEFEKVVLERIENSIKKVSGSDGIRAPEDGSIRKAPSARKRPTSSARISRITLSVDLRWLVKEFHSNLASAGATIQQATLTREMWAKIFQGAIAENNLVDAYRRRYPGNELFETTVSDMTKVINERTTIDSIKIQSLLINPETNIVKNGSSDTSVFTVQAEMSEEGFFLKTMRDSAGVESKIVEFD